jgi:aryl-alcohol dehydrogenase-like predicted oxidoreductase
MSLRNPRYERFAYGLAEGKPAYQAYIDAGFAKVGDAQSASRLLKNQRAGIRERVAEILREREQIDTAGTKLAIERTAINKEWVIERPRENVERATQAQPVLDRAGNPTGSSVYNGAAANRAQELLGKELGMFIERRENKIVDEFETIMNAVEDSLRRIGTDYIDLYYIHHVDIQAPLEEMLRAFDDLVRQGKIRYPACSNYEAWRLMEALWISDSKGLARFEAYQPQYSLVVRDIEEELVPTCALKGLGMVVWAPLAGGYLSGKYRPGEHSLPGSRSAENRAFPTQFFHPEHEAILTELLAVARRLGRNAAQVAVRWVLEQPLVASAIVGARTAEQLSDTLDAAGWRLPEEAREQLDKVSAQPHRYPRAMEETMAERRNQAVRMRSGPL